MVYSTRRFVLCLTLCHFVLVFFSPFSIAITLLGKERANLSAFDRLIDLCLFGYVSYCRPLVLVGNTYEKFITFYWLATKAVQGNFLCKLQFVRYE